MMLQAAANFSVCSSRVCVCVCVCVLSSLLSLRSAAGERVK